LCNPTATIAPGATEAAALESTPPAPRYREAITLCEYVESQIFAPPAMTAAAPVVPTREVFLNPLSNVARPLTLPSTVPHNHVHRLQNLFYAKGNLKLALGEQAGAQDEYEKAIEIGLSLPEWARRVQGLQWPLEGCTTRDLVVAATVIAKLLAVHAESKGRPDGAQKVAEMAKLFGIARDDGHIAFERLLRVVRQGGDAYARRLLAMGGGVLPTVLLEPKSLAQLPNMLFPESKGAIASMFDPNSLQGRHGVDPARQAVLVSTNQTTSTMLLTLAKVIQDSLNPTATNRHTIGGIPASQSLLLPLYYVALALYPSPSTCNNLGILLSTLTATAVVSTDDPANPIAVLNGQGLALRYYEYGLKLDNKHPHLYTNLGSLLKDMGQLHQAVAMYKQAVAYNPGFDVALANLANAVKDLGQIQESIPYYRRAVALNPNFPEAVCGLVNALGGVCDWAGRGGVGEEWLVSEDNRLEYVPRQPDGQLPRAGYMSQISSLVQKQLYDGYAYGVGSLSFYGGAKEWLELVSFALLGGPSTQMPAEMRELWTTRFNRLLAVKDRRRALFNEGGYLIRLIERLSRRTQRRWYLTAYGQTLAYEPGQVVPARVKPTREDVDRYRRIPLPPSLPPIPVPTVLPFHCFTLPVTARETRLISHRTGLRISHSTLNQPWMPPIVYPPPRPPIDGKINLGYVSSDLGNHPLSHLMQSVFGMHDLSRFNVFVYATSPSDGTQYRQKIEAESQNFVNVSSLSTQQIVERIVHDEIHVLVNLSGYTKGARNEVFAARPAPVQMSYMGFASTLSAGWCDYFIVGTPRFVIAFPFATLLTRKLYLDPIVCPPGLVSGNHWRQQADVQRNPRPPRVPDLTEFEGDPDPEGPSEEYVYTEKRESTGLSLQNRAVCLIESCSQSSTCRIRTLSPITSRPGGKTTWLVSCPEKRRSPPVLRRRPNPRGRLRSTSAGRCGAKCSRNFETTR
jgi:tetratricopeptide (TPR) repeat protein